MLSSMDAPHGKAGAPAPFQLTRWFGLLSLASLAITAVISATLLSRFVAERMLHRTSEVTMEFVYSLIRIHDGARFFDEAPSSDGARLTEIERVFGQVARMPDVIHANLYDRGHRVIWSTIPDAIGKRFEFNPELEQALAGALVVESDVLKTVNYIKPEHVFLGGRLEHAVETYIPVRADGGPVVGVVELYVSPQLLLDDIRSLTQVIWLSTFVGAAFLFVVLLGIVRRADAVMRAQQRQLLDARAMAAVGEMASAVAHGIRNPLASIRSSAELTIEDKELAAELSPEIVRQVDRLERWVRRLLSYAYQRDGAIGPVSPNPLMRSVADAVSRDLRRHRIELTLSLADDVPDVPADRDALEHALTNLVANAIEAMPQGGRLTLATRLSPDRRIVEIAVGDTGVGIPEDRLGTLFEPFRTSKPAGLGVGLPMVRRAIEALGGRVEVDSRVGAGTRFTLFLPLARR